MTGENIRLEETKRRFSPPRFILLALVVLGTIWAFNAHFSGLAERMAAQAEIADETGLLPPDRLTLLKDASQAMRQAYGVSLKVHVRAGAVSAPPEDPKTLFIGLDTQAGTAVVSLPPLLAKALPPELAASLQNGYFAPYFAAGSWPEGLYSCVLTILEALDAKR